MHDLPHLCTEAREASRTLATLPTAHKNAVLFALAERLKNNQEAILEANEADLNAANHAGLASAKLQRLTLTERSIDQLALGLIQVAALPDPVGSVVKDYTVPSGLHVRRVRCPLGVIAMIYEARPGVTIDAFALCFKAGNACILKGGREAAKSNAALADLVHAVLSESGVPQGALVVLPPIEREDLKLLLQQDQSIDLVIPRGGTDLIRFVAQHSRIPTIQHYQGVCHIFVDATADLDLAENICATAKTSAPATCNAAECILIHESIAPAFIPRLVARYQRDHVQVRADEAAQRLAPPGSVTPAAPEDFGREFLDLVVAMKVVPNLDAAIGHIARYASNHTESIITRDAKSAEHFLARVQSSCTLVNASTRFNDGFQLGLGAEIGISTSKIHAYGPMGLEELTTTRYIVEGTGQTR